MQTPPGKGLAVADRGSHLCLWLTVGLGLAADLVTKSLGWRLLGGTPEAGGRDLTIIPGWLRLVASENPGIVFGFRPGDHLGLGPWGAQALTILLTLATSALIFYVFASSAPRQRWMHFWCGLILAGALGNLVDRIIFGHVRDLIQITGGVTVGGWTLDWPHVFNVADVYLVAGVAAVALAVIFGHGSEKRRKEPRGES